MKSFGFLGLRNRENLRIFWDEDLFFLVFIPEFVEIRDEDLFFLVYTLEFEALKFLCP